MELKPVTTEHIDPITVLYLANVKSTYIGLLPQSWLDSLTPEESREKWTAFLSGEDHVMTAAWEDGQLLGFVAAKPDAERPGFWYLDTLHVGAQARGKGVGTALIRSAAQHGRTLGYHRMSISLVTGNDTAKRLYRSLGAQHHASFSRPFSGVPTPCETLVWPHLQDL